MTKKDRQREEILQHGFRLLEVFNLVGRYLPVDIYKKVHRLEAEAHRLAERGCNEELPKGYQEKKEASILRRLDALLNFKAQGIPVFLNLDPRGYSLKIGDEYMRSHSVDIDRDWGGYGIIAPEF